MTTLALAFLLSVLCSCSTASPQAGQAASGTAARLELEVDWKRASELGVDTNAPASVQRTEVRDVVAWRLAVVGMSAQVELADDHLQLVLPGASEAGERAAVRMLESLGTLEFQLLAEDYDVSGTLRDETARFEAWRAAHPDAALAVYNADPARPERRIAWLAPRFAEQRGPPMAVLLAGSTTESFGARDLARVYATQDRFGYPALGFELVAERKDAFRAFTAANVNRRMAIVLHGEVRSAPTLNSELVGSGLIEGRFKDEEVRTLAEQLQAPRGPLRLVEPGPKPK